MTKKRRTKHVHAGQYVAAVEVELLQDDTAWAPYLSPDDAYRLDDVRDALRRGDLKTAGQYGAVYHLDGLH